MPAMFLFKVTHVSNCRTTTCSKAADIQHSNGPKRKERCLLGRDSV